MPKSSKGKVGDKAFQAGKKGGTAATAKRVKKEDELFTTLEETFFTALIDDWITQEEADLERSSKTKEDPGDCTSDSNGRLLRASEVPELVIPQGLQLKNLVLPLKLGGKAHDGHHTHFHHHGHHAHENAPGMREPVSLLLRGMPGNLTMTPTMSEGYFGSQESRQRFYSQYKWIEHQRKITEARPSATTSYVYFEPTPASAIYSYPEDVPFAPRRPVIRPCPAATSMTGSPPNSPSPGLSENQAMFPPVNSLLNLPSRSLPGLPARSSPLSLPSKGNLAALSPNLVTPATPWTAGTRSDPGGLRGMHSKSAPVLKSPPVSSSLVPLGEANSEGPPGSPDNVHSHSFSVGSPSSSHKHVFSDPSLSSDDKYAILQQQHGSELILDKRGRPKVLDIPVTVHGREHNAVMTLTKSPSTFRGKKRGMRNSGGQRVDPPRTGNSSPPKAAGRSGPWTPKQKIVDAGPSLSEIDELYLKMREARRGVEDIDMELEEEMAALELQSKLLKHNDTLMLPTPLSPRSTYLAACAREGVNPLAGMVIRKGFSKVLNLQHQAIGDTLGKILAESITHMPFLQSLNLQDNRLTDVSLGPILKAIVDIPALLELNVSNNKMDDVASETLASYLGSETCPLERLVMRNADVDDTEGSVFISVLCQNRTSKLRELDMSHNLLGSAEQLNTVMDNLTTAGEAFAELLKSTTCTLEKLVVSWNMIRLGSGVAMASALGSNRSITELDLSSNAFGVKGGLALAASLMTNHSIRVLNISNNSIESTACFAICASLCENKTIRRVVFDDNPIGVLGAKALMQVPSVVGSRVALSARGCNVSIRHGNNPLNFSFDDLIRSYNLDLSKPFERAAAVFILNLVACHHTLVLTNVEFAEASSGGKMDKLELVPFLCADKEEYFDNMAKEVKQTLDGLLEACSDTETAKEFFDEVDEDGSGELEPEEFRTLLQSIGIDVDDERLAEVFEKYDTDQGGTLGLPEFYVFLRKQHTDVLKRLDDHLHTPSFTKKGAAKMVNGKIDPRTPKWLPPVTGRLNLTVVDGFKRKPIYRTLSGCDKRYIEAVAAHCTDPSAMTAHGVNNVKLRVEEAFVLFQQMEEETRNKSRILTKLLPQLSHPDEAHLLVAKALRSDRMELLKLKQALGAALRPLLGTCNGYYILDLSQVLDRLCLMRLLEISATRADSIRAESKIPRFSSDFSFRRNNNSCFRNEVFTPKGGKPQSVTVDDSFASPLPSSGCLSFDFSGGGRPGGDDMVTSDARVVKTLFSLYLLTEEQCSDAMRTLGRYKRHSEHCLKGNGITLHECGWDRSMEISEAKRLFYDSKVEREEQYHEAVGTKEENTYPWDSRASVEAAKEISDEDLVSTLVGPIEFSKDPTDHQGSLYTVKASGGGAIGDGLDTMSIISTSSMGSTATLMPGHSILAPMGEADMVAAALAAAAHAAEIAHPDLDAGNDGEVQEIHVAKKPPSAEDEYQRRLRLLLACPKVSKAAKAARVTDALDSAFNKQWLLCRQLALVVLLFRKLGTRKKTQSFGSYRVEVIVLLFERLTDRHNFDLVLRLLKPEEVACVIARIGWLNFYCPLKPEGCIDLNLAIYEERLIAKMMNTLATVEPGDNWPRKQFRWKHTEDPMPGWELKMTWMEDLPNGAGLPERGYMGVQYYAGEGKRLRGCVPHARLRKALLHLVNIREEDVHKEEVDEKEGTVGCPGSVKEIVSPGVQYITQNEVTWRKYLLA